MTTFFSGAALTRVTVASYVAYGNVVLGKLLTTLVLRREPRHPVTVLPPFHIRRAVLSDVDAVASHAFALWPDSPLAEHGEHASAILGKTPPSTLPLTLLVAESDGAVIGFIEVGLRSHADGCDPRSPVGFIEGWYVAPEFQRRGVGRALMSAAEEWSRSHGARELASDTWVDEEPSQRAHAAVGFELVDRCVHFRKAL